jgi:hypothetical protein
MHGAFEMREKYLLTEPDSTALSSIETCLTCVLIAAPMVLFASWWHKGRYL